MVLITNLGKNFAFTFVTAIGDEEIIGSALGSHCVSVFKPRRKLWKLCHHYTESRRHRSDNWPDAIAGWALNCTHGYQS